MWSTGNTSTLTISQLISIPSVNSTPLVKSHIKSPVSNFTHQSTRQSVNSSTSKFINQSSRPFANSSSSQVIHQIIRPSTKSSINHPLKRSFADSVPTATTGFPLKGAPSPSNCFLGTNPPRRGRKRNILRCLMGLRAELGCTNRPRPPLVGSSM